MQDFFFIKEHVSSSQNANGRQVFLSNLMVVTWFFYKFLIQDIKKVFFSGNKDEASKTSLENINKKD